MPQRGDLSDQADDALSDGMSHELGDDQASADQGIMALLSQLTNDAGDFARAELRHVQAQAGERVQIAIPALYLMGASLVLAFAVVVAALIGIALLLAPLIGAPIAILIICVASAVLAWLCHRAALARMARVFERLDR